jgi:Sec-independent protein translocase protein TatA
MRPIGPMELLVILGVAVLLLLGGKRIPELAEAVRNFRDILKGGGGPGGPAAA